MKRKIFNGNALKLFVVVFLSVLVFCQIQTSLFRLNSRVSEITTSLNTKVNPSIVNLDKNILAIVEFLNRHDLRDHIKEEFKEKKPEPKKKKKGWLSRWR